MMVLDAAQWLEAQGARDQRVNDFVIGAKGSRFCVGRDNLMVISETPAVCFAKGAALSSPSKRSVSLAQSL